jgi:site-specific DNA-methyltransferase (adenine-specific)
MFSSKNMNWETPQNLFDKLDSEFHFTLDVCATKETAKCKKYYTPEIDGLKQDWQGIGWCNPPYGRGIINWIKKAYNESVKNNSTIICLIPARTDTKYQHEIIFKYAKAICFIKGRLKFGNSTNSAPFPSEIIVFGKELNNNQFKILNTIGFTIRNFN